jgi:hypothetical protein
MTERIAEAKMKRSSSTIDDDEIPSSPAPSQSGSEEFKPDITPSPTSKTKKTKAVPKTPTPRKRVKKESNDDSGNGGSNGEWTPEKKGVLIDRVIAAGYKVLDIGGLAKEVRDRLSWLDMGGVADEIISWSCRPPKSRTT